MENNQFNLHIDSDYVVLKLSTGEQILAVKREESTGTITIEYPMLIKTYAFQNGPDEMGEHVTATPYCKFSEDKLFTFRKENIIFEKKLHQYAIPYYVKMVNEFENTIEVKDDRPETVEELSERVDNLMEFLQGLASDESEEEAPKVVMPTTKTIH